MSFKGVGYARANNIMKHLVESEHLIKTESGRYQLNEVN